MAHEALRRAVWQANLDIVSAGLVALTWGNASAVDREAGLLAIKPSGVPYDRMEPADIVLVSLETGRPLTDGVNPSLANASETKLIFAVGKVALIKLTNSRVFL